MIKWKKIRQNKLYTQTHHSFSRFKIFIDFYRISTVFILQTCTKTLKALRATLSDTVPAYLTLYMRARKQPEDLAHNRFQRCQDITVG